MAELLALLEEARRSGDLGPLVAAVPCTRFLGLSAILDGEGVLSRLAFAPQLVGNTMLPALHGGALGALCESAAVFELLYATQIPRVPKTINLTVEYLRSAKPTTTFARADIIRHGRRLATVRVLAWQDDRLRPVVAANAHFLLAEGG